MARVLVPDDIAARVLFYSDRTCCICRIPKKPLQIHHIDGKNSNNEIENLAVLCLDCHTDTQIKGGFGRKLDSAQVKLYREEWYEKVGRSKFESKLIGVRHSGPVALSVNSDSSRTKNMRARVSTRLKKLEGSARLFNLILDADLSGKLDLRDKYIDKLLLDKSVPVGEELYLRAKQGKVHLVDKRRLEKQLSDWKKRKNWASLARAYRQLARHDEAVEYYCRTCIEALKDGRPFSAGYYIKEMMNKGLGRYLFERALQEARDKEDVWWQIRSLQELGREEEIDDLVLRNQKLIQLKGRAPELQYLNLALKRVKTAAKSDVMPPDPKGLLSS